ncbi:WxL domain-containing protein [Vagococcus silagei]|nr:WxL domain-containing protein [Vagococcus silagei]
MKKIILSSALVLAGVSAMALAPTVDAAPSTKDVETKFKLNPSTDLEGSLKILEASPLEFKGQDITDSELTTKIEDAKPSIIKIDEFSGSKPGWSLNAKASPLKSGSDTLLGATIKFKSGEFTPDVTNIGGTGAPVNGANFDKEINTDGNSSAVQIVKAEVGTGAGKWELKHKDIELKIPSGNSAGDYKGTMTYTLTSGPTAPTP